MNKVLELGIVFVTLAVTVFRISTGEAEIILHWDFLGRVTDYGSKYFAVAFPLLSCGLYCLFDYYQRKPEKLHLKGVEMTEQNKKILVKFILIERLIVLTLLAYIAFCAYGYLPFSMILVVFVIIVLIGMSLYGKKLQIRNYK